MAKSTFLQLCQTVRQECGLSGTGPVAVSGQSGMDAKVVSWTREAIVEVEGLWNDWDFLWSQFSTSTSIGEDDVAAPANIGMWDKDSFYLDQSLATYKKLTPVEYTKWRNTMRNGVIVNQTPDFVIVLPDQNLKLHNPPAAVHTLTADYWKKPARLTANSETASIPEEYERIIIARAKMSYAEHDGVMDILGPSQIEFDVLLDKLEGKYLPSKRTRRMSEAEDIVVRPV